MVGREKLDQIYHKVSGAWKSIRMAYTKVGGVWKAIFANDIQFIINFAGFGNENGNPASGTVGTAGQPPEQSQVESGGGGGGPVIAIDGGGGPVNRPHLHG